MFVCVRKQHYLCIVKRNNNARSDARDVKV